MQSVWWLGCVLDGPESLSRQGLDIIFFKTSSTTMGSTQPPIRCTQPPIRCILGFIPWVKVWGLNFTPLPPTRHSFTSRGNLYAVLSDNCYLYLHYFHDTHRANGNRTSFIHDTDMDLWESSAVGIATKLWTGQYGVRFPVGDRDFALLETSRPAPGSIQPHSVGTRGKAAGMLTTYLHSKVKNEWSYASAPSICLHGIERENFISFFFLAPSFLF